MNVLKQKTGWIKWCFLNGCPRIINSTEFLIGFHAILLKSVELTADISGIRVCTVFQTPSWAIGLTAMTSPATISCTLGTTSKLPYWAEPYWLCSSCLALETSLDASRFFAYLLRSPSFLNLGYWYLSHTNWLLLF